MLTTEGKIFIGAIIAFVVFAVFCVIYDLSELTHYSFHGRLIDERQIKS